MHNQQGGFVKLIILIVILLVVLGYFGFNVQNIINSPVVSGNLHYAWGLVVQVWNTVLVGPATFVWNKILVPLVWNPLMALVGNAQDKFPGNYDTQMPSPVQN